jgi:hypothetical protein
MSDKVLYSNYPAEEVLKGLYAIVSDLRDEVINVGDVYHKTDRERYMTTYFNADRLPDPAARLVSPVVLADLEAAPGGGGPAASGSSVTPSGANATPAGGSTASSASGGGVATSGSTGGGVTPNPTGGAQPGAANPIGGQPAGSAAGAPKSRVKPRSDREFVIPNNCHLWITDPRINAIYYELLTLSVNSYSNSCSVILRVFVELSVDHHVIAKSLLTENQCRNLPLAKRLKVLAEHLRQQGEIDGQLENTVKKIADGVGMLGASTITFNQYVHNRTTFPIASELRVSWDELQPFMSVLWKK